MPRPKFIADACLNQNIVDGIRRVNRSIDFLTADEGGTRELDDPSVLSLGAATDRIVVSHDCNTMTDHFYRFIEQASSPGLVMVSQKVTIGVAIENILQMYDGLEASGYRNVITWLPLNPGR